MKTTGTIKKIIGPVVDVDFGDEIQNLPEVYSALEVTRDGLIIFLIVPVVFIFL